MTPILNVKQGPKGIPPIFKWPVQLCIYSTVTTYILSLLTGNFSQVDRVWTFLPTMYSAYYALLPLWPRTSPSSLITLVPVTPTDVDRRYLVELNPRALLMFGLQVRSIFTFFSIIHSDIV